MRKGIDIQIKDNTIEGLKEALKINEGVIKSYGIYGLKIGKIRLDFDHDENTYYLQIRF
jgi:hypothetical protein